MAGARASILFLHDADQVEHGAAIDQVLRMNLPHEFCGYPTSFTPPDPKDSGTQLLDWCAGGQRGCAVNHRVVITTWRRFLLDYLGLDLNRNDGVPTEAIDSADWLTFPQEKLRTMQCGGVFHDEIGLCEARSALAWYPNDVWLYMLAAGWQRIGQEEHLLGRAGGVGDEIGSALIGARLVHDIMSLGFLIERQFAPYAKWFGTAFARLRCATSLAPHLAAALAATTWQTRQAHLSQAPGSGDGSQSPVDYAPFARACAQFSQSTV